MRRDRAGRIRLVTYQPDYERLVGRAFEKIRQAGRGLPAVMISQLVALHTIMEQTAIPERRQVLLDQAVVIHRVDVRQRAGRPRRRGPPLPGTPGTARTTRRASRRAASLRDHRTIRAGTRYYRIVVLGATV